MKTEYTETEFEQDKWVRKHGEYIQIRANRPYYKPDIEIEVEELEPVILSHMYATPNSGPWVLVRWVTGKSHDAVMAHLGLGMEEFVGFIPEGETIGTSEEYLSYVNIDEN